MAKFDLIKKILDETPIDLEPLDSQMEKSLAKDEHEAFEAAAKESKRALTESAAEAHENLATAAVGKENAKPDFPKCTDVF